MTEQDSSQKNKTELWAIVVQGYKIPFALTDLGVVCLVAQRHLGNGPLLLSGMKVKHAENSGLFIFKQLVCVTIVVGTISKRFAEAFGRDRDYVMKTPFEKNKNKVKQKEKKKKTPFENTVLS